MKKLFVSLAMMTVFYMASVIVFRGNGNVYHVEAVKEAIWKMQIHNYCLII